MRGAFWWIDRWRKSTAYICMSLEQQGLYRNLLDAVWLFDGRPIPNEEKALITASGGDAKAWKRSGATVLRWMRLVEGGWVNDTATEVIDSGASLSEARSAAGRNGAAKRWQTHGKRNSKQPSKTGSKDIAPDPDPDPLRTSVPSEQPYGGARSKRPIFSGQRFTVFEWQLDQLSKLLGAHLDAFDLHQWFFDLDEQARRSDLLVPQRDNGAWLLAQTQAEAQRRGLPVAASAGKLTTRLAAAMENIRREAQS